MQSTTMHFPLNKKTYSAVDIIETAYLSDVVQDLLIKHKKKIINISLDEWNTAPLWMNLTSVLCAMSVSVTSAPTFAATNPGSEVPAPSWKSYMQIKIRVQNMLWTGYNYY